MSDKWRRLRGRAVHGTIAKDKGMTLPEVLISIAITGLVASTLAMATTVILRQTDNTEGRTNNARSEQSVNLWMPTDLASAESVYRQPLAAPCGSNAAVPKVEGVPDVPDFNACPPGVELRGSNAMLLTWHDQIFDDASNTILNTLTTVSYRVVREADGEFVLYRVQCYQVESAMATCESRAVLRDLDPPPATVQWTEGVTSPTWVIKVTDALKANDTSGVDDEVEADQFDTNKNAQRLIVTINGGGDGVGAGAGGQNQISLSAGGTNRDDVLSTSDLDGNANFGIARSRCGGNFGMVVDHSSSISQTELNSIKTGIRSFIDTFAGTPIKLQIVIFDSKADTLGATSPAWGKYFNMLDENDVTTLRNLVGDPAVTSSGIQRGSGTNWEDGFFRMLRNADGTLQSQLPGTIIFFTDGMPTRSRLADTSAASLGVADPADEGLTSGSGYDQVAWNRAERLVRDRGAIDLIGVYVDTALNLTTNPQTIPKADWMIRGPVTNWEMGNTVVFQKSATGWQYDQNLRFQVGSSKMLYERLDVATWKSTTRDLYLAGNTTPDSSDGWRVTRLGSPSSWVNITGAQYLASNTATGSGDNWRFQSGSGGRNWLPVTKAQYDASNSSSDESDGWRATTTWSTVTQAEYNAGNVDSGTNDGYRTTVTGTPTSWVSVTAPEYTKSNSIGDATDGWRSTTTAATTVKINSYATIGNLIVGNTTGVEGGFNEALPRGGPYLDAAAKDLYVMPNYTNFSNALASVALDQCGGTVTLQTRVGSLAALDPFKYQISANNETVTTSAAYRSGTFDVALPGGTSQTVTITPQASTTLDGYAPAATGVSGWSCKAAGAAYPFTVAPVANHAPWTSITLTVSPNRAVSCIQQVVKT